MFLSGLGGSGFLYQVAEGLQGEPAVFPSKYQGTCCGGDSFLSQLFVPVAIEIKTFQSLMQLKKIKELRSCHVVAGFAIGRLEGDSIKIESACDVGYVNIASGSFFLHGFLFCVITASLPVLQRDFLSVLAYKNNNIKID